MITRMKLLLPLVSGSVFGRIPTLKVPGSNPEVIIIRSKKRFSSLIHGISMVATALAEGEQRTGMYWRCLGKNPVVEWHLLKCQNICISEKIY